MPDSNAIITFSSNLRNACSRILSEFDAARAQNVQPSPAASRCEEFVAAPRLRGAKRRRIQTVGEAASFPFEECFELGVSLVLGIWVLELGISRGIAPACELNRATRVAVRGRPANIRVSSGALAQLVRAPPCHGGGCGFEPRRLRGFLLLEEPPYRQLAPIFVGRLTVRYQNDGPLNAKFVTG